jgi:DNA repair exonuclease SbcCD ATPase subunit
MMTKMIAVLFAASLCVHASARSHEESKVTPIEKVMELLKNLQKEVEAEGQAEAKAYDKYACFCKEQADEKLYMIEKSTKKIAKLDAKIKDLEADIAELNAAIKDLATEIERLTGEIDEAASVRAKAHAAYLVVDADTVGALTAMEGAIAALKDAKGAMSGNVKTDFAQIATNVLAVAAAHPRRAMLKSQVDELVAMAQTGAAQPAYEVRSNGILQTLEEMKDTFNENKKQDDQEEFDANSAWEKKDLNLNNVRKFSEDEKFQKEQFVEAKTEEMGKANVDKTTETKDMGADNEFMEILTEECEGKAEQFDQRSKTRVGELTALAGALDALAKKVAPSAGANKKLAQIQTQQATSFLQLRGAARSQAAATATARRAAEFLSDAASRIGSSVLALAAARADASADHFVKVRQIIKDLVSKLEADAAAEADQKSFCDKAIGENVNSRDSAIAQVESLTSKKSQLTAEDGQLHKEITELATDIASLNKGLKEAAELRQSEKEENEATLATAEEGRAGTELALKILNDFYAAAGGASLAQFTPPGAGRDGKNVGDMAPDSPDGEYKGNQEKSKGIVGLLEVIESDFERTLKKVAEDEQTAQDDFDAYKKKTEEDVATKEESKQSKEDRRAAIADELIATAESLKEETDLWETSKKSLAELKSQCIDGEESYEDRVAKRKKEIEALKQAHDILEDWKGF